MSKEAIVKMVAGTWAGLGIMHAGAAVNNEIYANNVEERIADFDERGIDGHFSAMTDQEEEYRRISDDYWDKFIVDGFMVVASLAGGSYAARRSKL